MEEKLKKIVMFALIPWLSLNMEYKGTGEIPWGLGHMSYIHSTWVLFPPSSAIAPRLLSTVWCNLAGPAEPEHYLVDPIGQISVGVSSTSHDHCLGAPSPIQTIVFYGIAPEVLFPLDFESYQTYSWSCTRCSRDHLYGMLGIEVDYVQGPPLYTSSPASAPEFLFAVPISVETVLAISFLSRLGLSKPQIPLTAPVDPNLPS